MTLPAMKMGVRVGLALALTLAAFATPVEAKPRTASKKYQPTLKTPAEDAELRPGSVSFSWKAFSKPVRFEVARDEAFSDIVHRKVLKTSSVSVKLAAGTYWWHVVAAKGGASEPRQLVIASDEAAPSASESTPSAAAEAPAEKQPDVAAGGFGLDLSDSTRETAAPEGATPTESTETEVASGEEAEPESVETERAETESAEPAAETSESGQGRNESPLRVFAGVSGAYGFGAPASMLTARFEAGVAYRFSAPFEMSLAIGGSELTALGTREPTWPAYDWVGQVYGDLSARYRLARLGSGLLFGLGSARLSYFTAASEQLGFLSTRSPFSVGAGVGYRFRLGIPVEIGLRGNLLFGTDAGGELELGLRAFVF